MLITIFWYWWLNNIVAVNGIVNLIKLWYSLMYSDFNDIGFPGSLWLIELYETFYNIGCELPRGQVVNGLIISAIELPNILIE